MILKRKPGRYKISVTVVVHFSAESECPDRVSERSALYPCHLWFALVYSAAIYPSDSRKTLWVAGSQRGSAGALG